MNAFLMSTLVVALAEIGDKTQLLSLLLAARYKKPLPIIAGILVATLANHFIAGALGEWIRSLLAPEVLRWIVGGSLLAIAAWTLKPDKLDGEVKESTRYGVFALTCVVFFLAEIGDKTQIATIVLAAKYQALAAVVIGTTLGMMIANVPVVFFGSAAAHRIPFRTVRLVTALLFAALGVAALLGVGT
jgi:putative Ca2+/H+ antiporter (TMEM165/GDT1 family)